MDSCDRSEYTQQTASSAHFKIPDDLPSKMTRLNAGGRRDASVLIPLLEKEDGLHILFEIRSAGIRQGGEVCFPGGRVDEDEDSCSTAVREACEELLVDASQIRVLAPMFRMTGPGGREIHSWLGMLEGYRGTYSEGEVAEVFTMPVRWFLDHPPQIFHARYVVDLPEDFPWEMLPGGRAYPWQNVPKNYYFYETPHAVIWGMTAELLYNCIERLRG